MGSTEGNWTLLSKRYRLVTVTYGELAQVNVYADAKAIDAAVLHAVKAIGKDCIAKKVSLTPHSCMS